MTLELEATINLGLYETKAVVKLQAIPPGTYRVAFHSEGNSLLSTLYLKAADSGATVKANYWDYSTGSGDNAADPGDRYDLQGHPLLLDTDAPKADRLIVTSLHNKPNLELIVSGGSVTAGIYITVVSSFASDLDSNLKLDGQSADLARDKGLPPVTYDPVDGKFYFLRSDRGVIAVTSEETGAPGAIRSPDGTVTAQNAQIDVTAEATVPPGKVWRLRSLSGVCGAYGSFTVTVDGVRLDGVKVATGPGQETPPAHRFDPYHELAAGQKVIVKYAESHGPVTDVDAVLYYTETDA